jgi:leucine-rich repeat protein SHOC2
VSEEELEAIIEKARIDRSLILDLSINQLTSLPESIGKLYKIRELSLSDNQLKRLSDSICQLSNLRYLSLSNNQLEILPASIGQLSNLTNLDLFKNRLWSLPESIGQLSILSNLQIEYNQLQSLPESLGQLSMLSSLSLDNNQLQSLPESFSQLSRLKKFSFQNNQLENIPESISRLFNLRYIHLSGNPLTDLTILQSPANLIWVSFFDVVLPRRYWTKLSEWNPEWLLDEENAEIRQRLIQQIGYEKIYQELDTKELDGWREYTLLKIDNAERFYDEDTEIEISQEPMVLLKMTCPSTGHIHILRVPPAMTSAEAAITWVNHGIHPDEFSVQT